MGPVGGVLPRSTSDAGVFGSIGNFPGRAQGAVGGAGARNFTHATAGAVAALVVGLGLELSRRAVRARVVVIPS